MTVYALLLGIERRKTVPELRELGFAPASIWRMRHRWMDAESELRELEKRAKK